MDLSEEEMKKVKEYAKNNPDPEKDVKKLLSLQPKRFGKDFIDKMRVNREMW